MPRFGTDPQQFFETVYTGPAPWDIGRPQPALLEQFHEFPPQSPVLDVGCGTGDLAIALAATELRVVGADFVPAAIEVARARAQSLSEAHAANLEFRVADALAPSALGRFASIVDTGFYHLFERDRSEGFVADLARALTPGGRYHLLAFAISLPARDVPREITEAELRERFSAANGWIVRAIRPATFLSHMGEIPAIRGCFERAAG